MDLGLHGQSIISVDFSYTVSFDISGGYEIRVETPFSLRGSEGDHQISPGADLDVNSPRLASLTGQAITSSVAEDSGALRVDFAHGARLRVEPDSGFEAWTVAGPNGMKVVCLPGGELAVWSAEAAEQQPDR